MNEGGIDAVWAASAVAGVHGDHEAGEGGAGEPGDPGGCPEVSEAERQVHREGAKGRKWSF